MTIKMVQTTQYNLIKCLSRSQWWLSVSDRAFVLIVCRKNRSPESQPWTESIFKLSNWLCLPFPPKRLLNYMEQGGQDLLYASEFICHYREHQWNPVRPIQRQRCMLGSRRCLTGEKTCAAVPAALCIWLCSRWKACNQLCVCARLLD